MTNTKYGIRILVLLALWPGALRAGGGISGQVLVKGGGARLQRLAVTVDQTVCGKEQFSESLLVGKNGEVQNAVVWIRGSVEGGRPFPSAGTYRIDQRECRFQPHLLLVPQDRPIRVLNSDGILHNFHTESRLNPPVNRSQSGAAPPLEMSFSRPEFFRYRCDVHGWMEGWMVVQGHPYYALTSQQGRYELTDLPAGVYTLGVWHEVLGTVEKKVSVEEGKTIQVNFLLGGLK